MDFQSGVNGTPALFVNEERLDWDFEITTLERATVAD
jgi:protein-disulfide isomerase